MSEISPRITYSDEGILKINVLSEANTKIDQQVIESLNKYDSVEIIENKNEISSSIEIARALGKTSINRWGIGQDYFVKDLSNFIDLDNSFYHADNNNDGVFGVKGNIRQFGGVPCDIYSQFQSWININGIDEVIAKRCLGAMALPFGNEYTNEVRRSYRYYIRDDGGHEACATEAPNFCVSEEKVEFDIYFNQTEPGQSKKGKIMWSSPVLRTQGYESTWGITGDRTHLYLKDDKVNRLYKLSPHNIDTPRIAISLLLGMGSLAYEATKHNQKENIYSEIQWDNK